MKKKMNWKLLVLDILTLAYIVLNIYSWNEMEPVKKMMHTILAIGWICFRIDDHYQFYKKERRLY